MTKTTSKAKTSDKRAAVSSAFIVLGFDDKQKPRGARFEGANPDLVAKAAQAMDLRVYEAKSGELAELAKKLPVGRLYATGKGFVPNIRQSLYSQILVALAGEPGAALGDAAETPSIASGLPKCWDEIAPVISSSRKKALRTDGGNAWSSPATATCSRCGSETFPSYPSSRAIARQSRW